MERVVDPETGLIYLRNRYYDPQTAQFLTRDPLDPVTRSAYGYTGDDPLNGSDPSGMDGKGGRKRASRAVIQALEELYGVPIEKIKTGSGDNAGPVEVYVDPDGTVVVAGHGGKGEGEPIATMDELNRQASSVGGPMSTEQYLNQQNLNADDGVAGSSGCGFWGAVTGWIQHTVSSTESWWNGLPAWQKAAIAAGTAAAIASGAGGIAAAPAL